MSSPEKLTIVADFYNRYPVEVVQIFLSPTMGEEPGSAPFKIQAILPPDLRLESYHFSQAARRQHIYVSEMEEHTIVDWTPTIEESEGAPELVLSAHIKTDAKDGYQPIKARLLDKEGEIQYQTAIQILVKRHANTFRYLPEIYFRDDFTNRFLMLFESFWTPITRQIDSIPYYFDPMLTPERVLPWIGEWFGVLMGDDMPVERKRQLLGKIAPIFRKKGTPESLVTFLEMYTGGKVFLKEHMDSNFVIGKEASLGYQIALGTHNKPHTFDITLTVPEPEAGNRKESEDKKLQFQRQIDTLITLYKPAHTVHNLKIEYN